MQDYQGLLNPSQFPQQQMAPQGANYWMQYAQPPQYLNYGPQSPPGGGTGGPGTPPGTPGTPGTPTPPTPPVTPPATGPIWYQSPTRWRGDPSYILSEGDRWRYMSRNDKGSWNNGPLPSGLGQSIPNPLQRPQFTPNRPAPAPAPTPPATPGTPPRPTGPAHGGDSGWGQMQNQGSGQKLPHWFYARQNGGV